MEEGGKRVREEDVTMEAEVGEVGRSDAWFWS